MFKFANDPCARVSVHAVQQQEIRDAEIVIGYDTMSQHQFLAFGHDAMQRIATPGEAEQLCVLVVEIDQETDELEMLLAKVQAAKGQHDYVGVAE